MRKKIKDEEKFRLTYRVIGNTAYEKKVATQKMSKVGQTKIVAHV